MTSIVHDTITTLRRFNRTHARRSGTLADSFLGTGRAYGPSRLLFEIEPGGVTTLELRRRLDLDSGYLSRLLRQLEADALVTTSADPGDGRRRIVRLTQNGHRSRSELDARSDELAGALIDGLSERQLARLSAALDEADRLLSVASVEFVTVDPEADEAIDAMTTYFAELDDRFDDGFDMGSTLVTDAPSMRSPGGAFVVARIDDQIVGCGGVLRHDDRTSEIKRMWVDAGWRGYGLGARLLDVLERAADALGSERVVLDTNDALVEAISMYERAGYTTIERYNDNPYADHWFTKSLRPRSG